MLGTLECREPISYRIAAGLLTGTQSVLTGAWVPGATLAVLATWAVLGAIVAGVVLRRAGQRENGTRNH